ncbi:ABC-type glycerol-3-phosphate transport system substrate-binding protein [Paenibacillus sp. DS2015]|uniref:hypothetical protein n=1 Tax=Paenibacillus sp. DS2015 TaxID=3373917 RepID=UPI003D1B43BC
MKAIGRLMIVLSAIIMLTACGSDKADVSVFITDDKFDPSQISEELNQILQEKMGEELKVKVTATPIFNLQKLMIEYATHDHDIIILPENEMKVYGRDGANIVLDSYFDPETYSDGVFEGGVLDDDNNVKTEKHLYGIPVSQMKAFQDLEYTSVGLYATIAVSSDSEENAVKVLKAMIE